MVVAGHPDTTSVTLAQIAYHTEMVRRGAPRTVIVSDLPIHTYDTPPQAVTSARRLLEAGRGCREARRRSGSTRKPRALRDAGIPVCGHLGMLPQRVREEGGYKKKGKTAGEADGWSRRPLRSRRPGSSPWCWKVSSQAVAGKSPGGLPSRPSAIGSGPDCDGQVGVLHDVTGAYPWFCPSLRQGPRERRRGHPEGLAGLSRGGFRRCFEGVERLKKDLRKGKAREKLDRP